MTITKTWTVNLTDSGDDGPTEEEGVGYLPSAGEIRSAFGIHTSLNRSNHLLQTLVFSHYIVSSGDRGSIYYIQYDLLVYINGK